MEQMDMDPPISPSCCPLCDDLLANSSQVTVGKKGLVTLINSSKNRGDDKWKQWVAKSQIICHVNCRKTYIATTTCTKSRTVGQETAISSDVEALVDLKESSNSSDISTSQSTCNQQIFDFKTCCLYCGKIFDIVRKPNLGRFVQRVSIIDRIREAAELQTDTLGSDVLNRLRGVTSLIKAEARYHNKCYESFFRVLRPERAQSPATALNNVAFERICTYIENSGNFEFTPAELQKQGGEHSLSVHLIYTKLAEKYSEDINIDLQRGKRTIIRYKHFDFGNMCQRHYRGEELLDVEKRSLFKVVADLLRKDIKKQEYNLESYPPGVDIIKEAKEEIPESLSTFLQLLISDDGQGNVERLEMKRSTVAHAITSAIHGQSYISLLQLAVSSYVQRKTGSRLVIDLLEKMGIGVSYYHLLQFETSIVLNPPKLLRANGVFFQFIFDNTDHNVYTVDGYNSFHSLGGIVVYTPASDVSYEGRINRVKKMNTTTSVTVAGRSDIPTVPYHFSDTNGLEALEYLDMSDMKNFNLSASPPISSTYSLYLWAKAFGTPKLPSWSGFMEVLNDIEMPQTSNVVCLPFINQPPSHPTTIYTALHYAQSQSESMAQNIVFVTYDQPLYFKARAIVAESQKHGYLKHVVVRLGGFHCLMSYLGAVGYIMSGAGLDSLWSTVYAPNSVKHMLTGHAYSRAMRAHVLTFTALGIAICKTVETEKTNEFKAFISSFLEKWEDDSVERPTIGDCRNDVNIAEMTEEIITQINNLHGNGPTAQLWLQYFELIIIALQFIEAERVGDWTLHLQSMRKMLPVFHAAGHLPYAKSAQLYLQDMLALENLVVQDEASESAYRLFSKEGYFTVKRSDKMWSGIWTDMTIEQTLNRYFGTDLKHGRGVTPGVVARYLLSMPTVFDVMTAVEDYFQISTSCSEQHKDIRVSRQQRDEIDLAKFSFWIQKHEPFQPRPHLVSLTTGVIGEPEINCHMAIKKGEELMLAMVGKNAKNISLSMKNRVKTLESSRVNMHIGGSSRIKIDSTQLFHRISVKYKGDVSKRQNAFEYELAPMPLALFDENGFMRKTAKSELYKVFKMYQPYRDFSLDTFMSNFTYVIDGGFLLHYVGWPHGQTYGDIFELYRSYIVSRYGGNAWVIFDGYSDEFIGVKSYERYRRNEKGFAADIEIAEDKFVSLTKHKFLSNIYNKFQFVKLLSAYLSRNGVSVKIAEEDADSLIVKSAIGLNQLVDGPVAVVGNDTDLFVLLIALSDERKAMYFNKVVAKQVSLYSTADHAALREFILFAHAFVGCDTTSALHGKGKKTIISLLVKSQDLRQRCQVYYRTEANTNELVAVAQDFIFQLYGIDSATTSLGLARYSKYETSTMTSTMTRLSSLPPTAGALTEHAKRVYLQIQTWLGNVLRPEEWGWKRSAFLMLTARCRAQRPSKFGEIF